MSECNEYLDRAEAAAFLRISVRTLDRIGELRKVRVGQRRVIYRRADLTRYVASRAGAMPAEAA